MPRTVFAREAWFYRRWLGLAALVSTLHSFVLSVDARIQGLRLLMIPDHGRHGAEKRGGDEISDDDRADEFTEAHPSSSAASTMAGHAFSEQHPTAS